MDNPVKSQAPASVARMATTAIPGRQESGTFDRDLLIQALIAVGEHLQAAGYRFTTVTPTTHARVVARGTADAPGSLRAIFGWNLAFADSMLPASLREPMHAAGLLRSTRDGIRSTIRFSSIGDRLYAHDGFPTSAHDAVFFGPDTYRFVAAVRRCLRPCGLLVDLGCGSGAGGLEASDLAERVVLTDISPRAMAFATANRLLALRPRILANTGDLLAGIAEEPDAIIANPPYMLDPQGRIYRDGAGELGTGLSLRILAAALDRLAPGGQLVLYTGSPIVAGKDRFAVAARRLIVEAGAASTYTELDPDVFGDELDEPAYAEVDRIAAVLLTVTIPRIRPRSSAHAILV